MDSATISNHDLRYSEFKVFFDQRHCQAAATRWAESPEIQ
jgi:hypothetical protein